MNTTRPENAIHVTISGILHLNSGVLPLKDLYLLKYNVNVKLYK